MARSTRLHLLTSRKRRRSPNSIIGTALEMDRILLDRVLHRTMFYLVVRVIIDSILCTEHRFSTMIQYGRTERTYFFNLLICFTPSDF